MKATTKHELYISQYKAGMTLQEIAGAAGVATETVRRKLLCHHKKEYLAGGRAHWARINEVMSFLIGYKRNHDGCSPSIHQIIANTSYMSTSSVVYALHKLERQGKIIYAREHSNGRRSRRIEVVGGKWTYSPPANGGPKTDD